MTGEERRNLSDPRKDILIHTFQDFKKIKI